MSKVTNNHGLRTSGRPTGNFGRPKVQGKRESLDISPRILQEKNLVIPSRDKAFARLQEAYEVSTDPRIRSTLREMLRSRQATLGAKVSSLS